MHLPFKTTIDLQNNIEYEYSRKHIREYVLLDIDKNSDIFKDCIVAVKEYMKYTYYTSKNNRIKELANNTTKDIVLELFIAILPLKIMTPIQSISALMANRLDIHNHVDGIKTCAEIIATCESTGLFTLYHATSPDNDNDMLSLLSHYSLDSHTETLINRTKYLPPMVCQPDEWTNNKDGGYLQSKSSVILGNINHHNENQNLLAINILQDIAWSFTNMVEYNETPNKQLDTDEKKHQFNHMAKESTTVYQELMEYSNKFYFVWKYDKRGRSYNQGYHVNLQSTEYKKAIINFNHKELIK